MCFYVMLENRVLIVTLVVKVFLKARSKAKEELKRHLAEFLSKRTVGLGTIFGPSDAVLDETIHDKAKEVKIVESLLLPRLESLA